MITKKLNLLILLIFLISVASCGSDGDDSSLPLSASAGENLTVMSMTPVTLDASGSTGDIVSYAWVQTAGTTVTLSDDTSMKPTFTTPGLLPGISEDLIFSLTVTDGTDTAAATVTITVLTWKQVDMGIQHTIALRSDGTLWAWGGNCDGQIGQGDSNCTDYADLITQVGTDSDWVEVSAGDYHNLAMKSDGTIFAWGWNRYGQIGNNISGTGAADVTVPTQVGSSADWIKVNAREEQSYAIDVSGNVYGWGNHGSSSLGLGNSAAAEITTPTLIRAGSEVSGGGITTLVIDGTTLWSWGNNAYGQQGVADTTPGTDVPNNLNGLTDVTVVACGGQHSYILRDSNTNGNYTLWSMGINTWGRLGQGLGTNNTTEVHSATEITVSGVTYWTAVASGKSHGLAVAGDGTLWAWGYNNNGQLGIGTSGAGTEQDSPQQVGSDTDWHSAAAWLNHSAGLKSDGTLWLWGRSSYGALGDDTISDTSVPTRIGYFNN